jgi:hypothetical protein
MPPLEEGSVFTLDIFLFWSGRRFNPRRISFLERATL